MKYEVLDQTNKATAEVDLSDAVFGVCPRKDIISRVVLWQLAKKRSGSHNVKGKSDVHGTTKKMRKQKGSGGARHGSRKAVQFRGGGVIFGPVNRDHGFGLLKKVRKAALRMALSSKAQSGDLVIVDSLGYDEKIKTKDFLNRFGDYKSALFIDSEKNENVLSALSNVYGFDFLPQIGTNVCDVIQHEKLVISLSAIKDLEGRLA
jgi:large subunit ribosomal protein L4